ncbi:MAG: hypothetical protein QOF83_2791, partial [Solirubrobacteraceae bacterium]|nr:hypothetical protein [Solirubrobacteraceae bacterium]
MAILAATLTGALASTAVAAPVVPLTTAAPAGTPVLVTTPNRPPKGFRLTATRVLAIAAADPRVRSELRRYPKAQAYEYTKGIPVWQVSWFSPGR